MKSNPIQFAVVREDSSLEAALIEKYNIKHLLTIGSGGCSALNLQAQFPELNLTLYDMNAAQLSLIEQKIATLQRDELQQMNIENSDAVGLNQCGNFESLFRSLRLFIWEFIADQQQWHSWFHDQQLLQKNIQAVFAHPYWPVAFQLFFSDPLLNTMFGEDATQHAPKDSYPGYFQAIFEKGLSRTDAIDNYFLHHILLGYYLNRPQALPLYLSKPQQTYSFGYHHGKIEDIERLEQFDMLGFSNIFDWSSELQVYQMLDHVLERIKPGTIIYWRQLNNHKDYLSRYVEQIDDLQDLANSLLQQDRSLFYCKFCIARKK